MKLSFDQGTSTPLRNHLPEHCVASQAEKGWSDKDNGALLDLAEQEGYDVLATTDQSIRHQQNLTDRRIGLAVLLANAWPVVRLRTREISEAIAAVRPGEVVEVRIWTQ